MYSTCTFCSNYTCSRVPVCDICYAHTTKLISLTKELQSEIGLENTQSGSSDTATALTGLARAVKCMKEMKEKINERLDFLSGFVAAFKEQTHADIMVKPGTDEPSLPTHRALLAARSVIFKHMLDSDKCKAPPNDTITFQELNYEELECLLEFLYTGDLPKDKVDKHVYSLLSAAHKYEIPFLQKFCQERIISSLKLSNVLDVLEIADTCSNPTLKETALNFILKNMKDVVLSDKFDVFVQNNPHLTVQITRASFTNK